MREKKLVIRRKRRAVTPGWLTGFAGAESSLTFAQSVLRKGGRVVVAGLIGGSFKLPIPMFPLRAIAIEGSYAGTLDQARRMLDLVRAGGVAEIPVEIRDLSQANACLDDLRAGRVVGRLVLAIDGKG